jgi:hypothetical protein
LRSEKYSSAAETSIFNAESRIPRISPVPGLGRRVQKSDAIPRLGMVFGPIWQ